MASASSSNRATGGGGSKVGSTVCERQTERAGGPKIARRESAGDGPMAGGITRCTLQLRAARAHTFRGDASRGARHWWSAGACCRRGLALGDVDGGWRLACGGWPLRAWALGDGWMDAWLSICWPPAQRAALGWHGLIAGGPDGLTGCRLGALQTWLCIGSDPRRCCRAVMSRRIACKSAVAALENWTTPFPAETQLASHDQPSPLRLRTLVI